MADYLRILHISDLHIPFDINDKKRSEKILERFLCILKLNTHSSYYQKVQPIDHIIITGDLYNSSTAEINYDLAVKEIIEILLKIMDAALVKDRKYVHLVPGNHDLVRDDKDVALNDILNNPDTAFNSVDSILKLKGRFNHFWELCDAFYGYENPWKSDIKRVHCHVIAGNTAFIYMNTEMLSISTKKDDRLGMSTVTSKVIDTTDLNFGINHMINHIATLLPSHIDTIIFLAHHPICQNQETDELKKYISGTDKNYYWFCGHMHSDRIVPCDYMHVYQSGGLFGIGHTIPDFTIHSISNENESKRSAFRYLYHLNDGDMDGNGGWKQVFLYRDSTTSQGKTINYL